MEKGDECMRGVGGSISVLYVRLGRRGSLFSTFTRASNSQMQVYT